MGYDWPLYIGFFFCRWLFMSGPPRKAFWKARAYTVRPCFGFKRT